MCLPIFILFCGYIQYIKIKFIAMNTLTAENRKICKLEDMTPEDLIVYKAFFTTLIKMGRETKHVLKHKPDLTLSEYPHLTMLNNNGNHISIYYSVNQNAWILQRKPGEKETFNPKAISGLVEFLSHFDNEIVIASTQLTDAYIESIINLYVKNT